MLHQEMMLLSFDIELVDHFERLIGEQTSVIAKHDVIKSPDVIRHMLHSL